jgi:hypothetical protein
MTASRVTPASSARTRAASLLLAVLALTGCLLTGDADRPRPGDALATDGAQSSGVVGHDHARLGRTWYFALPVPVNESAEPVEITGVALEHVPVGLKVVRYGAYDLEDTEGLPLLVSEGDAYTPDFDRLRDHAARPVVVPARRESRIFYLAELRITSPPGDTARGCRFDYTQGGEVHHQTLDREVGLKVAL